MARLNQSVQVSPVFSRSLLPRHCYGAARHKHVTFAPFCPWDVPSHSAVPGTALATRTLMQATRLSVESHSCPKSWRTGAVDSNNILYVARYVQKVTVSHVIHTGNTVRGSTFFFHTQSLKRTVHATVKAHLGPGAAFSSKILDLRLHFMKFTVEKVDSHTLRHTHTKVDSHTQIVPNVLQCFQ